jgi:hypothetical protein
VAALVVAAGGHWNAGVLQANDGHGVGSPSS